MAKLMTMFIILVSIQAVLLIYHDSSPVNTVIWDFIMNVQGWGTLAFVLALIGIAGGIGLVGIAAASTFGFKTDFLIFAPAIAGLISCGVVFVNLANVIRDDLISTFFTTCSVDPSACAPVTLIVGLVVGLPALYYVWTIIEWWRGKDY